MLKKLVLAAAIFTMGVNETMAQTSVGKPTVPVYTKFSIGGEPGRMIFDLVRRMNELDTTRDYRFAHMPGAGGEIALGRAVIDARAAAPESVDAGLAMADGPSITHKIREGLVWKCNEDPSFSFKTISNQFLLKGGD